VDTKRKIGNANRLKLKFWPAPQDYNEAVQNLHLNIADEQLQNGQLSIDRLGLPRPMTGAFASVYRVSAAGQDFALRCFLRDTSDQEQRYQLISKFVCNDDLASTVNFEFIGEGIRVNGRWFPVLKMQWVQGVTLESYVRDHLDQPEKLHEVADRFVEMCADLRRVGVAHGDLQHGNVMVSDGELRLVDYDGMFVPEMQGMESHELGHPNYQHPGRNASHFGAYLDSFSAWVIFVSLRSIALDPSLYDALAAGDDCFLFRGDDLQQPLYSRAFWLLENHANTEIADMAKFLRFQLGQELESVPALDSGMSDVAELPELVPPPFPLDPLEALSAEVSQGITMPLTRTAFSPSVTPDVEPELRTAAPRAVSGNKNCHRHDPLCWQMVMLINPFFWAMLIFLLGVIPNSLELVSNGVDYPGTVIASSTRGRLN